MKKPILIVFFLLISMICWAQSDTVRIELRHDTKEVPLYVLDGLRLPYEFFRQLSFDKRQIKTTTAIDSNKALEKYGETGEDGVIEITSKVLIILNDTLILDDRNKADILAQIAPSQVLAVQQLCNKEQTDKYGKKAKFGVIYIKTKHLE